MATKLTDHFNSLYMVLPLKTIQKLQLIRKAVIGVLMSTSQFRLVIPQFCKPNWLPVDFQVNFRVLNFKALHGFNFKASHGAGS